MFRRMLPVLAVGILTMLSARVKTHGNSMDRSRFEEGRKEYDLIVRRTEMPKYGVCWKDAVASIERGCKRLTDDVQGRLALAYLNCFLQLQGRSGYRCDSETPIESCTRHMKDADQGSYTTFFTHTQNICYFLQSQVWQEEAESTIDRLIDSSSEVAGQLETSRHLQSEMMKQQNETLQNQQKIMEKTSNLSGVISSSSKYLREMFQEFKRTTEEQRLLIDDVFSKITKLQNLVLGEFSGFHSLIYYSLSLVIAYVLTSSQRTNSARFWLFLVVTVNVCVEQFISYWGLRLLEYFPLDSASEESLIYWLQRACRKVSAIVCLVILSVTAYNYQDLNSANNKLLLEIRKQNSELRHTLLKLLPVANGNSGDASKAALPPSTELPSITVAAVTSPAGDWCQPAEPSGLQGAMAADNSANWENESEDSSSSSSSLGASLTDRTYVLQEVSESGKDSYSTALSTPSQRLALEGELRQLRESTPFREMLRSRTSNWVNTGFAFPSPRESSSRRSSRSATPVMTPSPGAARYNLRPRRVPDSTNPLVQEESPRSFSRTVKELERTTRRNSQLANQLLRNRRGQ